MTKPKPLKQQITEVVLKEIPKEHTFIHELALDKVMFKWWMTGRQEGLRLTDVGATGFQLADIAYYEFEIKDNGKSWYTFTRELGKKLKCPYYITSRDKKPIIRIYDSKIAVMVNLYGELNGYLDSIKMPE